MIPVIIALGAALHGKGGALLVGAAMADTDDDKKEEKENDSRDNRDNCCPCCQRPYGACDCD